jgi:hypothetical protein
MDQERQETQNQGRQETSIVPGTGLASTISLRYYNTSDIASVFSNPETVLVLVLVPHVF